VTHLIIGEPAPLFFAPSPINPRFAFGTLGGRYILLAFLPQPGPERDAAIRLVTDASDAFCDDERLFFGILPDAESFASAVNQPPMRWFADPDGEVRRLFGATEPDGALKPGWILIDPSLRVLAFAPLNLGPAMIVKLRALGRPDDHAETPLHAPVLTVPRILEPDFCRHLIELYKATGGALSGVMREQNGMTVGGLSRMKKRRDASITDETLRAAVRARLARRLIPEIEKAFQFRATRIERYIVACYDAEEGGYFQPHRDNTSPGTAHRRFAVSINLNGDFDGGDLRFPEFGARTYRPPPGGAVVFSCSLLHEATPVTRGVRYATLPFLYDDAGAEIRRANAHTIVTETADAP
jgi:predicted 2-oxoglutarate/Fe(II)-dependent dioxygenase YbiX